MLDIIWDPGVMDMIKMNVLSSRTHSLGEE